MQINVFTRGDDCGSTHSANRAIAEACETGILRNVSFMMPCKFIDEAAAMFAGNRHICHGLHVTMNAEWDSFRWGPVLGAEAVPSLVDVNGSFFQTTIGLRGNNARIEEILAETQAQLDKATRLGLHIHYAEMHMGFGWIIDELELEFDQWCKTKGILNNNNLYPQLPPSQIDADCVEVIIDRIKNAKPGCYSLVGHPSYNDIETRSLGHLGYPGDVVAQERNWERLIFCDPRIVDLFSGGDIKALRYDMLK